jgi:sodium-dependent dicarboxylate transporter 2/3/5
MKGFCLAICYSASIGGAGSLVGTTPNLILKGHFEQFHPKADLNFVTYMGFALPISVIMIMVLWIVLTLLWLPKKYKL